FSSIQKYASIENYTYHQPRFLHCFGKLYFLRDNVKTSWKSAFESEKLIVNLNRIPAFVFIVSYLGIEKKGLSYPMMFLRSRWGPLYMINFYTPTKIFLLSMNSSLEDVEVKVVCLHCEPQQKTLLLTKISFSGRVPPQKSLTAAWLTIHR